MALRLVEVLAVLFTALCLVPAGAHLLELPHKIGLSQADYLVVQQIYRGWAFAGIALVGAVVVDIVLVVMLRGQGAPFVAALIALILIVVTLVTFFVFIYPVNGATADWTRAPENWEELRSRWEYTHAVNAVLTFISLIAVTAAAVGRKGW